MDLKEYEDARVFVSNKLGVRNYVENPRISLWEAVQWVFEYHQSKIQNIGRSKGDSGVTVGNGDYTSVAARTAHGETQKTPVDGALQPIPQDEKFNFRCGQGNNRCNCNSPEECGYI